MSLVRFQGTEPVVHVLGLYTIREHVEKVYKMHREHLAQAAGPSSRQAGFESLTVYQLTH